MKKNKAPQINHSGIEVTDNISFSIPKKNTIADHVPLLFTALCGCVGTVNSFVSMFHIEISYISLNFYILIFFLFFSATSFVKKNISFILLPLFVIYDILIYIKWDKFMNGLMLVVNQVYSVIEPDSGDYFSIDMTEVIPAADTKVFFLFALFLIIAAICYLTIIFPDFLFGFLITFTCVELGLYYGKTPHLIPAFILIVYWASLLSVHHSEYFKSAKRNKFGFTRNGNYFTSKPAVRLHSAAQSTAVMLMVSAAIIIISYAAVNISGYTRSQKLNDMRSNVKTAVSEFDIDDIGGSLERLSASFGLATIRQHNQALGNMDSVSYTERTDIVITADKNAQPYGNIYLKDYNGSVYNGKSWTLIDNSKYDKISSVIEEYPPQRMLYDNYGWTMKSLNSAKNMKITIKPSALNQRCVYAPYNSFMNLPEDQIEYVTDTIIDTDNKKTYSFTVSPYQDYKNLLYAYGINSDDEYFEFVKENYLSVPDNEDTRKLYDEFIDGHTESTVYEQLQYIKNILSDNAKYTLSPGKTPSDRDFVSYFLMDNHKGYCVHFATAGVILARMSGIPARYASGYILLENQFNPDNISGGEYKIEVKDHQAHAWAEIYLEEYGWIPFEFTPGDSEAFRQSEKPEEKTSSATTKQSRTTAAKTLTKKQTVSSSQHISGTTAKSITLPQSKSTASNTPIKKISKTISEMSPEMILLLGALAVVLLILFTILAVHKYSIKKRMKSFCTESSSQNAINAYNYILKLLEFCDIKNNNMQYLEFAEFAEQSDKKIFKPGSFTEITKIALEAGLKNHELSREKVEKTVMLSYRTALTVYRKQNFFGKLYMKFILNLC